MIVKAVYTHTHSAQREREIQREQARDRERAIEREGWREGGG